MKTADNRAYLASLRFAQIPFGTSQTRKMLTAILGR